MLSIGWSQSSYAGDKTNTPPKLVFDEIPARWDYYFLSPDIIEKYTGAETDEVCFDDDFYDADTEYHDLKIKRNSEFINYKALKGGRDFIVLGKSHILLHTPQTSATIIETKQCRKSLPRAKYLLINDNISRQNPRRCLKSTQHLEFFTRFRAGFAQCRIVNISNWKGAVSPSELRNENEAYMLQETSQATSSEK